MSLLIFVDTYRRRFPTNSKIVTAGYNVLIQQSIDMNYRKTIIPLIKKYIKDKEDVTIYSFDAESERKLLSHKIKSKHVELHTSKDFYKLIDNEAMDFVRKFPSMDKKLKNVLSYNDICLWDFLQYDTWHYFKKQLELIRIVDRIIKKEKPKKICIFDATSDIGKVSRLIAESYGVEVIDNTGHIPKSLAKLKTAAMPAAFRMSRPWGIGELKIKSNNVKKDKSKKTKFILFGNYLFPPNLLTDWSSKLGKSGFGDHEFLFVYYNKNDIKSKNLKSLKNTVKFRHITYYSDKKTVDAVNKKSEELKQFWNSIKHDENFKNKIRYNNIKVFPLIEELLQFYFMNDIKEVVKYIELSKNVFITENPNLYVSYDEISRVTKSAAYSAKQTKTPTILIQHGALADYPLYGKFYSDIFAVYGENTKKIYEKMGVKSKNIKITGNIKFDKLYEKRKNYNRERILKSLGIPVNKKIILFTSQPVTKEENEKLLYAVFNACKKFPKNKYHLIIKLHPAEDGRLHRNIARDFDNHTIIRDISIFEMIDASDVVITYWSTTGLEAMVLGKPVVVLNLSGMPDKVPYANKGAALGVYDEDKLYPALNACLNDQAVRQKLSAMQKEFIYNEAYNVDGRAIDRLLGIMHDAIKNKK